MKFVVFILFFQFVTNLQAQTDSIRIPESNIQVEIYPSPIYTIINRFYSPIPFKAKVSMSIKNRWSVGLGIEERLFFSRENQSQWFLTSDFYFFKSNNNYLSVNSDFGMFSYLNGSSNVSNSITLGKSYFVGYVLRGGITWKKRIFNSIYCLLYFGYESNLNRTIYSRNNQYWSLKLGLNFNSTFSSNETLNKKKYGITISAFVMNNLFSRKNDNLIIPYDRWGNFIEIKGLYKNSLFFLGRITPGIEFTIDHQNKNFHSLGCSYFLNFNTYSFQYGSAGHQNFNARNLSLYYDYSHSIYLGHSITPYLGMRMNLAKNDLDYEDSYSIIGPQSNGDRNLNFYSNSVFLQGVVGAKILDKKLFMDVGFTMNLLGFMKSQYFYDYRYFEFAFGTIEFSREREVKETIMLSDFINDQYFFGSIFLKLGYKF